MAKPDGILSPREIEKLQKVGLKQAYLYPSEQIYAGLHGRLITVTIGGTDSNIPDPETPACLSQLRILFLGATGRLGFDLATVWNIAVGIDGDLLLGCIAEKSMTYVQWRPANGHATMGFVELMEAGAHRRRDGLPPERLQALITAAQAFESRNGGPPWERPSSTEGSRPS